MNTVTSPSIHDTFMEHASNALIELRCCCEPENLVGFLPFHVGASHNLTLRNLEGGGVAFDIDNFAGETAADRIANVADLPEFVPATDFAKKGGKTWVGKDAETIAMSEGEDSVDGGAGTTDDGETVAAPVPLVDPPTEATPETPQADASRDYLDRGHRN